MTTFKITIPGGTSFPIPANSPVDYLVTCDCAATPSQPGSTSPTDPDPPKGTSTEPYVTKPWIATVSEFLNTSPTELLGHLGTRGERLDTGADITIHARPEDFARLHEVVHHVAAAAKHNPELRIEMREAPHERE